MMRNFFNFIVLLCSVIAMAFVVLAFGWLGVAFLVTVAVIGFLWGAAKDMSRSQLEAKHHKPFKFK